MAAMTLGKKTGGEEEGEGQEEEGVKKEGCLVCYKAIVLPTTPTIQQPRPLCVIIITMRFACVCGWRLVRLNAPSLPARTAARPCRI
jgi:hypothetical protein